MSLFLNDFAILHLSDLHIVSHNDNDYSTALHKMIDHIYVVTEKINKLIIVVTGDLVEKGLFNKNDITIKKFFEDLKNKLNKKTIDIIFTPGNHDKVRRILSLPNNEKITNDEGFWKNFKDNDWSYFETQFTDYLALTKHIREQIFDLPTAFEGTYGFHNIKIDNLNVCFLCFNSAWACMGDDDMGKLRIGRFQLDDIMKEYQLFLKENNIDLTIALMHHPTNWLNDSEQKYLNQYLIDKYRLNTNIILQGHVHDNEVYNWYNQNHSITTFVTGMGWDQQRYLNDANHRYSLYEINCSSGIARVNTYISNKNGEFHEDKDIYTDIYKGNNIIFPLYVHKYLEINKLEFIESEITHFYPNENALKNIGLLSSQVADFICLMHNILEGYKREYLLFKSFDKVVFSKIKSLALSMYKEIHSLPVQEIYQKINIWNDYEIFYDSFNDICDKKAVICNSIERLKKNLESIYGQNDVEDIEDYCLSIENFSSNQEQIFLKEKFLSFLGEFCINLQKKLFEKKKFETNDIVRLHFRSMHEGTNLKYQKLFVLTVTKNEENKIISIKDCDLAEIDYSESLIEQSFLKNKALLHSLNPTFNNHSLKEQWIDFLTIAPHSDFNIGICSVDDEDIKCPYITFGITVNNTKFQDILRNMSYIGFEKILDKLFIKFLDFIPYKFDSIKKAGKEEHIYGIKTRD